MTKERLLEEYITKNIDSAYRFAYVYTKNREDAEDVVTESVIKALRSVNRLRDESKIKAWFYRIIANTALTHLRQSKKTVTVSDEDWENIGSVFDDYSNISFEEIIKNLSPDYKTIIVLRFFENMKLSEISEVLGINENTVKTRLYRALKMLKSDMEGAEV